MNAIRIVNTIFPQVLFCILFLSSPGCKKTVVGPDIKNPREYSWSVQEISDPSFQVLLKDIWGSSASDVYAVAVSGSIRTYKLFHFDGNLWSEVDVSFLGSSQIGFNLSAVQGLSSSDIWASGERLYSKPNPPPNYTDSTLIIHFDGSRWGEVNVFPRRRGLRSIGAGSTSDIWFGGFDETLYHFDGTAVSRDSIGLRLPPDSQYYFVSNVQAIAGNSATNMYLWVYVPISVSVDRYYLYHGGSNGWNLIDSTLYSFRTSFWMSPSGQLYLAGYGLYLRTGNSWSTVLDESHAALGIYGSSDSNIFVCGQKGKLYHFNGVDWFHYRNLENPDILFFGIWTDGKEVFVIGDDGIKSYIYHGK